MSVLHFMETAAAMWPPQPISKSIS